MLVVTDVINVMAAYQPVVQVCWARRYCRDQCHGGIPACCASVLYTVEEGTDDGSCVNQNVRAIIGIFIVLIFL